MRIAHGTYTAPPGGADGRRWKPPLEAAGLAVATTRFGQRNVALMGVGAARFWGAIPRAIATTTIAVPVAGRPAIQLETGGTVHFIPRILDDLDLELQATPLGDALVTTPAQTLYDLLAKPHQGQAPDAAEDAARNLGARVTAPELKAIAARAQRVPTTVKKVIDRMEHQR
ncbi:type IV toxin-antitoxin system AbiEi family antitoxin [Microbacterium esteraromaticum]|uniref:type IV toxin-antitoxin system AbiEi family antitoxin n=1 Tax=Microbacterium esteraromaticum TaxID=57043 RepID=UPI0015C5C589|nr:type IV toxin-antitoxin system AbiEi family antitoxin [Microbacterium esteraromaticum]